MDSQLSVAICQDAINLVQVLHRRHHHLVTLTSPIAVHNALRNLNIVRYMHSVLILGKITHSGTLEMGLVQLKLLMLAQLILIVLLITVVVYLLIGHLLALLVITERITQVPLLHGRHHSQISFLRKCFFSSLVLQHGIRIIRILGM